MLRSVPVSLHVPENPTERFEVAGLSRQGSRFKLGIAHVGFVTGEVALRQGFTQTIGSRLSVTIT